MTIEPGGSRQAERTPEVNLQTASEVEEIPGAVFRRTAVYAFVSSPLRGMSEVLHPIPDCLQSLSQRVVRDTHGRGVLGGIPALLLLRPTARL
jgi:hypothetical protein